MNPGVIFKNVSYSEVLRDFSCHIAAGERAVLVTACEEESAVLARLLCGMLLPERGSLLISGCAAGELTAEELMQARSRMGVIEFHGGLVSNLKMWENIFLPLYYHHGKPEPEDDEAATNYLKTLGCTEKYASFPAHLSLYEKRAAAFVRAAIMQPRIMIYCNTLEMLPKTDQTRFASVINEFHAESSDRISIYLSSTPDIPDMCSFDTLLHIHPQ